MGIFGPFVETTCLKEDGRLHYAAMLKKTAECLENGEKIICEAAFSWYGNYCAADILRKVENGYALYEVKNTHEVRKEFITDLGFQRLLLRKSGLSIVGSFLILRGEEKQEENSENPTPLINENETENAKERGQGCVEYKMHDGFLYKIVDVTKQAKAMERIAEKEIFALGKLKKKDMLCPNIEIGEHCESPYRCWYYDYCRKPNNPQQE